MNAISLQVFRLLEQQHGIVATWQLAGPRKHVHAELRGMRRLFRGVYAAGDVTERGWFMGAALAMGPTGAVSHLSALQLLGLRPYEPGDIHVSHTGGGRAQRNGLIPHRRDAMEVGDIHGIPVTSPSQSLKDADLEPYELYRALEQAERLGYSPTLPLKALPLLPSQVHGRTRSDAEARALLLMHANGMALPRVNQHLNGIETDLHWPEARIVLEVDGWEFHKTREQFEEDRRRGLVHTAAGWQVIRVSALQVQQQPELLLAALQTTGW